MVDEVNYFSDPFYPEVEKKLIVNFFENSFIENEEKLVRVFFYAGIKWVVFKIFVVGHFTPNCKKK